MTQRKEHLERLQRVAEGLKKRALREQPDSDLADALSAEMSSEMDDIGKKVANFAAKEISAAAKKLAAKYSQLGKRADDIAYDMVNKSEGGLWGESSGPLDIGVRVQNNS